MEIECHETSGKTFHDIFQWKHKWTIENYKTLLEIIQQDGNNEWIQSPDFEVKMEGETRSRIKFSELRFMIQVFPDGKNQSLQGMSIFLQNANSFDLEMSHAFSILNNGKKMHRRETKYRTHSAGEGRGFDSFSEMESECIGENGSLTILCELNIFLGGRVKKTKINNQLKPMMPNLSKLRQDPIFSDIQIKCKNDTFHVHRNILSIRSNVFKAMFSHHNMIESQTGSIEMPDTEGPIMARVLDFIYSGNTSGLEENAIEILAVANKYNVCDLKKECENVLIEKLNTKNAVDCLVAASLHEAENLKEEALEFVTTNILDIANAAAMDSLVNLDAELFKEFLVRLGGEGKGTDRGTSTNTFK